jgi:Tfp pilus assembly protein FimT
MVVVVRSGTTAVAKKNEKKQILQRQRKTTESKTQTKQATTHGDKILFSPLCCAAAHMT